MCESNLLTTPQQASDWLQQGNLLAYPTESVWGIGCDAMNEQAVLQILAIKNRPIAKGMIVVTDSVVRIEPLLAELTEQQRATVLASWQVSKKNSRKQATTWLLPIPKDIGIPQWITGKHNSVAVRVIAHPLIQQVCANMLSESNPFAFIISTSCNPSTLEPAKTMEEAKSYFAKSTNVNYLQGQTLDYELPSQICDGVTGKIIR